MHRLTRTAWALVPLLALVALVAWWLGERPPSAEAFVVTVTRNLGPRLQGWRFLTLAGAALVLGVAGAWPVRRSFTPGLRLRRDAARIAKAVLQGEEAHVNERRLILELRAAMASHLWGEARIIELVDDLLFGAICLWASDVHVQPTSDGSEIYLRLHGTLEPIVRLPLMLHAPVINRLKVMARLVSYVSDRPQDGRFSAEGPDGPTDLRVSLLPTSFGEKAVMRIARHAQELPQLTSLQLSPQVTRLLERALEHPQGLIFLTGPTGSGKTTTLYGCLGHIKRVRRNATNIATIEDPIEFNLPNLTQTQVNPEVGLSFATGLRAILRQDPNVLMVGEIRDSETAHIAIQAGLTGHLILTTVHAESASGVFNRLIEMQLDPFLVASASLVSVSQRLVRELCPSCRRATVPTADEKERLERLGLAAPAEVWTAGSCRRCNETGYRGRRALCEVLEVTPALRDLINAKVPTSRIHEAALREGMLPLIADGIDRAKAGVTTLAEVLRVAG
jgi:general secretion pathway protein E